MTDRVTRQLERTPVEAPDVAPAADRPRHRRLLGNSNPLAAVAAVLWLLVVLVPLYWLVVMSLRDMSAFFGRSQWLPPADPTVNNFVKVIDAGFVTYLRNSVIVTVATVALILVVSLMAAYLIVRSKRRVVSMLFQMFLAGLAIPAPAAIIPIYFMITRMQMYDTLAAIILPSVAFGIPITVLILVNFLRDVPAELFEAMRVDGATEWRMLWQLAAPLMKPALITVGIYNAIHAWNGFLFPLVLTQSPDTRVLPLSLWAFQGEFGVDVPAVLSAVLLSALPLLALYMLARRQLIAGLTAGFGK